MRDSEGNALMRVWKFQIVRHSMDKKGGHNARG